MHIMDGKVFLPNMYFQKMFQIVISKFTKPQPFYRLSLRSLSRSTTMPGRDTTVMLTALRKCMKDTKYVRDPLQAYIVPSCDAHNSEYLAEVDARREALSGFTGSAGTAIVTPSQVQYILDFTIK